MDLFKEEKNTEKEAPLAWRMRPQSLEEFAGQEHILGDGKLLRRMILADRLTSLILFGPPGCGKTSLAYLITQITRSHFERLNATTTGAGEVRKILEGARSRRSHKGQRTVLLMDEINHFNKLQQEILLKDLEDGTLILIGATVYNPFFTLIPALNSRSQIFELRPLNDEDLKKIILSALKDKDRGLGKIPVQITEDALEHLIHFSNGDARKILNALEIFSNGDARKILNALEIGVLTTPNKNGKIRFTLEVASESLQKKTLFYDKDEHYDTISAFIKSMRGSDPDATLYWLAKMLSSGEDPRFIARRIAICASEDVGNADPQAITVAASAMQVIEWIGMPEAQLTLAQAAVYVATAPKSNAVTIGISKAMKDVETERTQPVPSHLQGGSYPGSKRLGKGQGYKYPHNSPEGTIEQIYLGNKKTYYKPKESGYERKIQNFLSSLKKMRNREVKQ
jgi:putative ATPase